MMEYKLPPLPELVEVKFRSDEGTWVHHWEHTDESVTKYAEQAVAPLLADPKLILDQMTDEQRVELFSNYCRYCGCDDPGCQCSNDE